MTRTIGGDSAEMREWKTGTKNILIVLLGGCAGAASALFSGTEAMLRNGLLAAGIVGVMLFLRERKPPGWAAPLAGCVGALPCALAAWFQIHAGHQGIFAPAQIPEFAVPGPFLISLAAAVLCDLRIRKNWSASTFFPGVLLAGAAAFCIRSLPYFPVYDPVVEIFAAALFAALPMAVVLQIFSVLLWKTQKGEWSRTGAVLSVVVLAASLGAFFLGADFFQRGNYLYFTHGRKNSTLLNAFDGVFTWECCRIRFENGTLAEREYLDEKDPRQGPRTVQDADGNAYWIRDGFVFRKRGENPPEKLCRGTAVTVHPDGGIVYFRHDRFFRLKDGQTTEFHIVHPLPPDCVSSACFDPDGKHLYYLANAVMFLEFRAFLTAVRLADGEEFVWKQSFSSGYPSGKGPILQYTKEPPHSVKQNKETTP